MGSSVPPVLFVPRFLQAAINLPSIGCRKYDLFLGIAACYVSIPIYVFGFMRVNRQRAKRRTRPPLQRYRSQDIILTFKNAWAIRKRSKIETILRTPLRGSPPALERYPGLYDSQGGDFNSQSIPALVSAPHLLCGLRLHRRYAPAVYSEEPRSMSERSPQSSTSSSLLYICSLCIFSPAGLFCNRTGNCDAVFGAG